MAKGFAKIPRDQRFVLANATLPAVLVNDAPGTPDGDGLITADITIRDGKIERIDKAGRRTALPKVDLDRGMVWPCFVARVPMAVAMLPEPMMLMVVMTCSLRVYGSVGWGSCGRAGPGSRGFAGAGCQIGPLTTSHGLWLVGLVVECGAGDHQRRAQITVVPPSTTSSMPLT